MSPEISLEVAWRDEQIGFLRQELRICQEALRQMALAYDHAQARAEEAETTLFNLREEIREAAED